METLYNVHMICGIQAYIMEGNKTWKLFLAHNRRNELKAKRTVALLLICLLVHLCFVSVCNFVLSVSYVLASG